MKINIISGNPMKHSVEVPREYGNIIILAPSHIGTLEQIVIYIAKQGRGRDLISFDKIIYVQLINIQMG